MPEWSESSSSVCRQGWKKARDFKREVRRVLVHIRNARGEPDVEQNRRLIGRQGAGSTAGNRRNGEESGFTESVQRWPQAMQQKRRARVSGGDTRCTLPFLNTALNGKSSKMGSTETPVALVLENRPKGHT